MRNKTISFYKSKTLPTRTLLSFVAVVATLGDALLNPHCNDSGGFDSHGCTNDLLENMSESKERKTIYLCLAHMSETGEEQKYVKEAFNTNWVVPMGPNVNALEEDLRKFVTGNVESAVYQKSR